jgi:hypothetical protein
LFLSTKGDCFGDVSIINNSNRNATITVKGNQPLCLLLIDRENFFAIQSPMISRTEKHKAELEFLRSKVKLLSNLNYPFDDLTTLNQNNNAYCSIYYRQGKYYLLYQSIFDTTKFDLENKNTFLSKNSRQCHMSRF